MPSGADGHKGLGDPQSVINLLQQYPSWEAPACSTCSVYDATALIAETNWRQVMARDGGNWLVTDLSLLGQL